MTATELLIRKAAEYEQQAAHAAEVDELRQTQGGGVSVLPVVWSTVALVLREVALALEEAA